MEKVIKMRLPLPPTINHYYGNRRNGAKFIREAGVKFREEVSDIVADLGYGTLDGRLSLYVSIYPANRRRQDIDNRIKPLQDALTHAGVWVDDSQIDELHIVRMGVVKGGYVNVVVVERL